MSADIDHTNGAIEVAELMSKFLQPTQSSDHDILNVVAEYSLQLRPDQQFVLNKLQLLVYHPLLKDSQKNMIKNFVSFYKETKRYHDTLPYIGKTVEALSLRKFWTNESMKGNVIKQER